MYHTKTIYLCIMYYCWYRITILILAYKTRMWNHQIHYQDMLKILQLQKRYNQQ